MRTHTAHARSSWRFALVAVTTLAAFLMGVGPAAAQGHTELPPKQDWRSCGSLLIKKASVTPEPQDDMFIVNLVPENNAFVVPLAWSDLHNCVNFPNKDTLYNQFECHAYFNWRSSDPVWNLESDRHPNNNWRTDDPRQHKCNWGHSDGGSSSP